MSVNQAKAAAEGTGAEAPEEQPGLSSTNHQPIAGVCSWGIPGVEKQWTGETGWGKSERNHKASVSRRKDRKQKNGVACSQTKRN